MDSKIVAVLLFMKHTELSSIIGKQLSIRCLAADGKCSLNIFDKFKKINDIKVLKTS